MPEALQQIRERSFSVSESPAVSARRFDFVLAKRLADVKKVAELRLLEEFRTLIQAVRLGIKDQKLLTDLIFFVRHPELSANETFVSRELMNERESIMRSMVLPVLNEASLTRSHGFDQIVASAVGFCPGLSTSMLAGLLGQESNFNPRVINEYGYAGVAQLGRAEASEMGLSIGGRDERLDPSKAIPAASRLLNIKKQRLYEIAFSRYGEPQGVEMWKFVLAAYNGGEGTVALAMGNAYRAGMAQAEARGAHGLEAVTFAKAYAGKWQNLVTGGMSSPLGLATTRYFPQLAQSKYREIGDFPLAVLKRSESWSSKR